MHKRRHTTVRCRTNSATSQMGIIIRAGALPVVAGAPRPDRGYAASPLLQYDHSRSRLMPLEEVKVETEWFKQGDFTGKDSSVSHFYSQGTLGPFCKVLTSPVEEVKEPDLYVGGERSSSGYSYASADTEGNIAQYLDIYEFGGYTLTARLPQLYCSYTRLSFMDIDLGQIYENQIINAWGAGACKEFEVDYRFELREDVLVPIITRYSLFSWLPPEDLEISDPNNFPMEVEWKYWNEANGPDVWEDKQMESFAFLPVEPIMLTRPDESDPTRVTKVCQHALRTVHAKVEKSTGLDGEFYSTQKAVETFRLINLSGIEFIADLMKLKELISPLIQLFLNPLNWKHWAQLLLWFRYGVKPTFSDIRAVVRALIHVRSTYKGLHAYREAKMALQTRYGTFREPIESPLVKEGKARWNSRVCAWPVVPREVDDLSVLIEDMGIRLSLPNIWDAIPFSFIIDWFLNVGRLLGQIDFLAEVNRLRLRERVQSKKLSFKTARMAVFSFEFPFCGELKSEWYKRDVHVSMPTPPFKPGLPSFLNHWWEGLLIILTGRRSN